MSALLAMSDWDRAGVAGQIRHGESEKERKRNELWEASRFYNARDARADVERWGRASVWELEEAVALSLDRDPSLVNAASLNEYQNVSSFAKQYFERLDIVQRAVKSGELRFPVSRNAFLEWMRRVGYEPPKRLVDFVGALPKATPLANPRPSAVNWKFWLLMPEVRLWEACALSVSVDPKNMSALAEGWMAGPGNGPFFKPTSFPTKAIHDEFEDRLHLLKAWRTNTACFTLGKIDQLSPANSTVAVSEFVDWAHSAGIDLPREMAEFKPVNLRSRTESGAMGSQLPTFAAEKTDNKTNKADEIRERRRALLLENKPRGAKGLILQHWETVEKLHGPRADGNDVLRVLKRQLDVSESPPELKTIQNHLSDLRKQKLIP